MTGRRCSFLAFQTKIKHKIVWILAICVSFTVAWLYVNQLILGSDIEGRKQMEEENETLHGNCKEPLKECFCVKIYNEETSSFKSSVSTCSEYSSQRGPHQKVVSYSYYNPDIRNQKESKIAKRYLEGVPGRAEDVKTYYPGWIMRVYHNVSQDDEYGKEVLCNVYCNDDHIDLCHVSELPEFGSMYEKHNGMFWRFLPLGDSTVDVFLSRDLDSVIQQREVDAVTQWLKSNATFHAMRDHPLHKAAILGGLWGAKLEKGRADLRRIRDELLQTETVHKYNYDQMTLRKVLWPYAQKDILIHDSFNCKMKPYENAVPFPTKRTRDVYIGWGPVGKEGPLKKFQKSTCPLECRPVHHPDWLKC